MSDDGVGLFGRIALAKGLISEDSLTRALRLQDELRAFGLERRLGDLLVALGALTPETAERVAKLQLVNQRMARAKHFAHLVQLNELAGDEDVERVLEAARGCRFKRPIQELFVEAGVLAAPIAAAVARALDRREPRPQAQGDTRASGVIKLVPDELATAQEQASWESNLALGAVALREGLLLLPELLSAMRQVTDASEPTPLEQVLVRDGLLGQDELAGLRAAVDAALTEQLRIPGYRIEDYQGHGATSLVLRARHELLDREVAIKVLREDPGALAHDVEAKATASVRHPHVIALYEAGRIKRRVYYVMELARGPTLMERIRSGPKLPVPEVVRRMAELADALDAVHAAGLVHGDVKPHNVLLGEQGSKLADLGLARAIGAPPRDAQTIQGSPHTLSPEQASGQPLTPQSDLYSLGATLFYALTGHPPFDAESPLEIVLAHLEEPVPDPRDLRSAVDGPLAELTMRLLAKAPEERPASAAEVRRLLQEWLASA